MEDSEERRTGGTTADAIVVGGGPIEVASVEEPWWWGEAVEEALTCPICVDVLRDAVETNCCHATYCRSCIEAWLDRRRGHGCPGCRAALDVGGLRRNIPIQRLVDLLPAQCPNVPCDAPRLTRGCVKEHLAKCDFATVLCPFDSRCPTHLRGEWNDKHQAKGVLLVHKVDAFKCVWMDRGTGSKMDGTAFRPLAPEGWKVAGDFFVPRHGEALREKVDIYALAERGSDGTYLQPPTDYELVWNDKKTGAKRCCSIWRPVPPQGFVALGYVVTPHHNKPSPEAVACVHHSCVRACTVSSTHNWTDSGSGGAYDVTVWALDGSAGKSADGRSFYMGVDCAARGYTRPSHPVYCLDAQAIHSHFVLSPPVPPRSNRARTLSQPGSSD